MGQQTYIDWEAARDDGIQRSSETSGEAWKDYAVKFIREYLQRNHTLHVDDLWNAGLTEPKSKRALGAVMQQAIRAGWMVPVYAGRDVVARPSVRSNGQLKAIWKSQLSHEEVSNAD